MHRTSSQIMWVAEAEVAYKCSCNAACIYATTLLTRVLDVPSWTVDLTSDVVVESALKAI